MPSGKGTYGSKVGRPPKKVTKKVTKKTGKKVKKKRAGY
jgi:hypothetical protein